MRWLDKATGGALLRFSPARVALLGLVVGVIAAWLLTRDQRARLVHAPIRPAASRGAPGPRPDDAPTDWSGPSDFGKPLNRDFPGVVCFRGNAQRNYYGEGPVPRGQLAVLWRAPIGADPLEPRWSGVGWTGQPLAMEWPPAVRPHMNFLAPPGPETEIIQGALDGQVHFYDAATGQPSRPALHMPYPNPIKGTVSVDPRGFPLLYAGCGLDRTGAGYRIFSLLDFQELAWIPGHDPRAPRAWPCFDANPLVLRDRLLLPGENGLFYAITLHTRWDAAGQVSIRPHTAKVPVTPAGIESSLSVWGPFAYCGDNHGNLWRIGLNQPLHVTNLRNLGDDTDSSVTFDNDGTFYVGIEVDHRRQRDARGTLFRLRAPDGARVWRWDFPAQTIRRPDRRHALNGGVLSSAAVWPEGNRVFITTAHHPRLRQGALVALDRQTGTPVWMLRMRTYGWSSPVVVDGVVVAADASGALYVRDAATGTSLLTDAEGTPAPFLDLGATVEGSPLVWRGRIYLGTRGGALLCLGVPRNGSEE